MMRIGLVGPELEENLGLRYLHSSIVRSGHSAFIFDFFDEAQLEGLADRIIGYEADIVGLSMVFTARAREFLRLADRLRQSGFRGHVTAGGHFASFHANQLLKDFPALDSIVHGEGEETIVDLADHLSNLRSVAGLSYRDDRGNVVHNDLRPNSSALDSRAFPTRSEPFHEYLHLPIANMLSSRGCFGNCTYCSINVWYRQNPGRRFRQRNMEPVAREMAELYHDHNVRLYNFHDDNFFLPAKQQNLRRLYELQLHLKKLGVGTIGIQVKSRPDTVDEDVLALLKEIGLFRVFLGIETNSAQGLKTLGRGSRKEANQRALNILRRHKVHSTFNLLIFDPDSTISDVRENIAFIRRNADCPLNICRTEVYSGTALESRLRAENRLLGDYFGYYYNIMDNDCQRVYEIFKKVFFSRNFEWNGTNHLAMSVDYHYHILKHFYPRKDCLSLETSVKDWIRQLNDNNAILLERICDAVERREITSESEHQNFAGSLLAERDRFDEQIREAGNAFIDRIRLMTKKPESKGGTFLRKAASIAAAVLVASSGCGDKESKAPVADENGGKHPTNMPHPTEMAPVPGPMEPLTGEGRPNPREQDPMSGAIQKRFAGLSFSLPKDFTQVADTTEEIPSRIPNVKPTRESFRSYQGPGGQAIYFFHWDGYPTRDRGPMASQEEWDVDVGGQKARVSLTRFFFGIQQKVLVTHFVGPAGDRYMIYMKTSDPEKAPDRDLFIAILKTIHPG